MSSKTVHPKIRLPDGIKAVGFTGNKKGMTHQQLTMLRTALEQIGPDGTEFHHGDCLGSDMEAASLAKQLGFRVVAHPPDDPRYRAFTTSDTILPEAPYLIRNRDIVRASDVLIAAPSTLKEAVRSGTWATVRYARQKGIEIVTLLP